MRSITRSGFSACIWAGSFTIHPSQEPGASMVIALPWSTQVEAFWSKSDQKGVTRPKSTSTRSTARTPSTASAGWRPRAPSSCMAVPAPPKRSSAPSARQRPITTPSQGTRMSEARARSTPIPATSNPGPVRPREPSALTATRRKPWGSRGGCGTMT